MILRWLNYDQERTECAQVRTRHTSDRIRSILFSTPLSIYKEIHNYSRDARFCEERNPRKVQMNVFET